MSVLKFAPIFVAWHASTGAGPAGAPSGLSFDPTNSVLNWLPGDASCVTIVYRRGFYDPSFAEYTREDPGVTQCPVPVPDPGLTDQYYVTYYKNLIESAPSATVVVGG